MTIPEILRDQARARPEQTAIIAPTRHGERGITFAELERCAARFASQLAARGLEKGDAVLVLTPMSIPLYIALLGIFRLGAVAMFIDPSSIRDLLASCCEQVPPRAMIGGWKTKLWRQFHPHLRKIPLVFSPPIFGNAPADGDGRAHAANLTGDDRALITFTSGSTGAPKGAVRTHHFLLAQHRALQGAIRLEPGEIDLTTLPIFVLANLASGITSLLPDADLARAGGVAPAGIATQIRRHQPTRTGGSPAFYEALVCSCEQRANFLAGFTKIYLGGAPVFPSLLARLRRLAPAAHIAAVYGSTEAEPIAVLDAAAISEANLRAMRSGAGLLAGAPVPEARVRILPDRWGTPLAVEDGDAWQDQPCAVGEPGEIVVSGDHVLSGYLRREHNAETKFEAEGRVWHRTGDAGYFDHAGRLWLLGRCTARIADEHGILYPLAAETIASFHPFIRRSALLTAGGQRCLVFEQSHAPAPDDLAELQSALAALHVHRLIPMPKLPTDPRHHAKIDYPRVRRLLPRTLMQT